MEMATESAKRSRRELFVDDEAESSANRNKVVDPVMLMRYGDNRRENKGVPISCDCGDAIHVATSNDPDRRGQRYFTCFYEITRGPGKGCGFKRWMERALLEEFELMKEEKQEMQQRLDEAHRRIDSQEGKIYEMYENYKEVMADRKQLDDYGGELHDALVGIAKLTDKHGELVRRFEAMEKKSKLFEWYGPGVKK